MRASSSDKPTKPVGTVVSPGPDEIVNVTLLPFAALLVASGSCDATRLIGIRGSGAVFIFTLKSPSNARASASVKPTTFGTGNNAVLFPLKNTPAPTNKTPITPAATKVINFLLGNTF